ncbi:F0F1 ATP synthase subunit delta [Rhodobaculum claviforme]|uniref:ATP synthase subunit delta n=1 Tax=Rhodobaculum claviforme TaxID=1549854 RepID=A0A934WI71_9RHOB|nr:F0F1 ATP synthase subunit delta [Rhodobaculum claviforme]
MSEPASISAGIAARYATAVFELARDDKALDGLERDVAALSAALADSADLRMAISSPIIGRADQERAVTALARAMKLSANTSNVLALMAQRRRLFVLPQMLRALRDRIAAEKGEITADVRSAAALSKDQAKTLADLLTARTGKTVRLDVTVDPALIGGLVVKVGSRMIDTSIRSRLAALQNAMKEVG